MYFPICHNLYYNKAKIGEPYALSIIDLIFNLPVINQEYFSKFKGKYCTQKKIKVDLQFPDHSDIFF